jgi:hypothetical protein
MYLQRREHLKGDIRRARRASFARLFRTAIFALCVCATTRPAVAACSGSSPTRTAASTSRADVNDCVTAAASGDTIMVPSGTATWASAITLPSNTDLVLQGATVITCTGTAGASNYVCNAINNTNLTCNHDPGCFSVDMGASQRVTGFTMTTNATDLIDCTGNVSTADHFRIDHNRLVSTNGWQPIRCKGGSNGVHPQGIWDHNRLENGISIHSNGTLDQLDECTTCQHAIWFEATPLGDSSKVIYVEANYFVVAGTTTNFADGNYGARSVIRFNTTKGSSITGFEYHSPQGSNRGYQRWETYNNHFIDLDVNDNCYFGMASLRGGTGVWFNNAMTGAVSGCNQSITMDNVRSADDVGGSVGMCNGSSAWDQGTSGQQGWHCRDQIGLGRDLTLWSHLTMPAWNQERKPAYVWGNTRTGSVVTVDVDADGLSQVHIVANRDFYDHSTATGSPQTVGVRTGTLANRPAGCTIGVAYWSTDEAEWNNLSAGVDGRLYKCTSTNTWTLYYTPHPYPHPWTGSGTTPPAAPTNLRIAAALFSVPGMIGVFAVRRRQRRRGR